MNKLIKLFSILIYMVIFSTANADDLTKQNVNVFLVSIDKAAVMKNANIISDTLSENVVIIINMTMEDKKQIMKLTKKDYVSILKRGWSIYKNYKYTRTNINIKIKNNKAFVTSNIKESMTIEGKNISGSSKEETTIELIDGKLLITKLVGYTSM